MCSTLYKSPVSKNQGKKGGRQARGTKLPSQQSCLNLYKQMYQYWIIQLTGQVLNVARLQS